MISSRKKLSVRDKEPSIQLRERDRERESARQGRGEGAAEGEGGYFNTKGGFMGKREKLESNWTSRRNLESGTDGPTCGAAVEMQM